MGYSNPSPCSPLSLVPTIGHARDYGQPSERVFQRAKALSQEKEMIMRERETVSRIDESKIRVPDYYEETCELLRQFVDSCPKCSVDEYNEFRDTFLSWLPDYRIGYLIEEREIQSQTILDLLAELYHKLKSKRQRQTPQQALT